MVPSEVGYVSIATAQCWISNEKKGKFIQQYVIRILAFFFFLKKKEVKIPQQTNPKPTKLHRQQIVYIFISPYCLRWHPDLVNT